MRRCIRPVRIDRDERGRVLKRSLLAHLDVRWAIASVFAGLAPHCQDGATGSDAASHPQPCCTSFVSLFPSWCNCISSIHAFAMTTGVCPVSTHTLL